ncbi:GcrA family cell cycle regulator [Fodinicurvata sediminis]|uniref:GcrA family cell cycle regulator n=1 Tax=Fodinicurvata sediminis TaxID=1121832 RepID=UPI0003B457C5|nr:GcrA family cell cycle regulator [Fodinicurvata sediminis]
MSWTPERIEELTRLWDEGQSASAIGKQLGISKNAVVGKAHRLKLAARPSPIRKQEAGSAVPQRKRSDSLAMPSRAEESGETAGSIDQAPAQAKPQDATVKQAAKSPSKAKASTEPETLAKPKAKAQPKVAPVENTGVDDRGVDDTGTASTGPAAFEPLAEAGEARASRPKPAPRPQPVSRKPKQAESPAPSNRKCQWPIGDPSQPDFHFCESPAAPGRPYCAEHCAMAYITRSKDSSKDKSSEAA